MDSCHPVFVLSEGALEVKLHLKNVAVQLCTCFYQFFEIIPLKVRPHRAVPEIVGSRFGFDVFFSERHLADRISLQNENAFVITVQNGVRMAPNLEVLSKRDIRELHFLHHSS